MYLVQVWGSGPSGGCPETPSSEGGPTRPENHSRSTLLPRPNMQGAVTRARLLKAEKHGTNHTQDTHSETRKE